MFVKHPTATSVATEHGTIESETGVFEVAHEFGHELIRLFGFEHADAPDDKPEGDPKPETAAQKKKREAAEAKAAADDAAVKAAAADEEQKAAQLEASTKAEAVTK